MTDKTVPKQLTPWKPGRSGNPSGRPKGARNKHSENFINAMAQDFEQHGPAVIERVRTERPHDYLRVAAALLPKQMEIETNRTRPLRELSSAELMVLLEENEAELRELEVEMRAVETLNQVAAVVHDERMPYAERVALASRMINEFGLPQQLQALEQQDSPVECEPISLLKAPGL
jgi:hypothetical protein